ncbi:hypothetical protein EJD97_016258 [Solanum chilense]|uniref:CCHC-type domain-containing protein n=1 Tax=Solanum chilense TaxID=4083 RepID=A0A6N2C9N0_SOLCI|nr:hypothetical protein EJD97_016258 [Solanum chilense]
MVANPRSRMNKFLMGVSRLVEKECRTTMPLNDMDISRLMVYAQQIKESKTSEIRKEGKSPRSNDSSYRSRKKSFYPHDSSVGNNDRSLNQHSQGSGHSYERSTSFSCGKQHGGKCLAEMDGCFACVHKGHKMRDCPILKSRGNMSIKLL